MISPIMDDRTAPRTDDGTASPPPPSLLRGTLADLRAGVRLALFRRVPAAAWAAAPGNLALLAALDVLLNLLLSLALAGGGGAPAAAAVPGFFFHLPLLLACGLVTRRLAGRDDAVTLVPTALVALSLTLELLHALCEGAARYFPGAAGDLLLAAPYYYRFFFWWLAAGGLFLLRLAPRPRRAPLLFCFVLLAGVPLALFPRGDLWLAEPDSGRELVLTEEVLDRQPRLLQQRLDGLLPGRPGNPDLYYVGFAGDAGQDVFMRETLSVARLFERRFGTAGRSVTLVNSPETALAQPFATGTNLRRALRRIGAVMDRDEDVLFLYLTSHGSEDQELTVANGPLELNTVTPEDLRAMLAEAGIRWRVIAVSACYSGGFIAPLKDDHTLIMTASDARHESFGCENGADYTWFGRAYFAEALQNGGSFITAFDRARATIARWEKEQGETPSNPQIYVGSAMRDRLAALERARDGQERKEHP